MEIIGLQVDRKEALIAESVVYLSGEDFKAKTLEYSNPGGISVFTLVNKRTQHTTIFIDTDRFKSMDPVSGESFEDILPFALDHEATEALAMADNYRRNDFSGMNGHMDNSNDEKAAYASMLLAFVNGKLDKYLRFLEGNQYLADEQIADHFKPYNVQPEARSFIAKDRALAERVVAENCVL